MCQQLCPGRLLGNLECFFLFSFSFKKKIKTHFRENGSFFSILYTHVYLNRCAAFPQLSGLEINYFFMHEGRDRWASNENESGDEKRKYKLGAFRYHVYPGPPGRS